jgi:hypothetical protein
LKERGLICSKVDPHYLLGEKRANPEINGSCILTNTEAFSEKSDIGSSG